MEDRIISVILIVFISFHGGHTFPNKWPESRQTKTDLPQQSKYLVQEHRNMSKSMFLSIIHSTTISSRTTDGSDGKIIFPSDEPTGSVPVFRPTGPVPVCHNTTFCENAPGYPQNFIQYSLRMNTDLKHFASVDVSDAIDQRIDADEYDSLCVSQETVIFPKSAENKNKEWLFVVNEDDLPQGVRIEKCMEGTIGGGCKIIDSFLEGYKTTCQQKYIYRQLAAITSHGTIRPDFFRFPSSCCCHVKLVGNPLARIGISVKPTLGQSPVPRALASSSDEQIH